MTLNTYDLSVSNIEFAVMRKTENKWKLENGYQRDFYILAFAENGCADYKIDETDYHITKGAMMFFKKAQPHSAVSDENEPWSFFSIAFDLNCYSDATIEKLNNLAPVVYVKHYERYREKFLELYKTWSKQSNAYMLKCRSIIEDLLYCFITKQEIEENTIPHEAVLESIKEYINANYKEHFSIKHLADMANMSPSYFRTLFKTYTGQTIIQYQNSIKIEHACTLLKSGLYNVTEAADATGFCDIYYFSRLFKKITGCTPSKYL